MPILSIPSGYWAVGATNEYRKCVYSFGCLLRLVSYQLSGLLQPDGVDVVVFSISRC